MSNIPTSDSLSSFPAGLPGVFQGFNFLLIFRNSVLLLDPESLPGIPLCCVFLHGVAPTQGHPPVLLTAHYNWDQMLPRLCSLSQVSAVCTLLFDLALFLLVQILK